MTRARLTFPLVSRRRLLGRPLGASPSSRRGPGVDRAGSRAYRPGDDVRAIDHRASARLSSARGDDAFVVREHLTEEAPAVVLVVDGAASMHVEADGLPLLDKRLAARVALALVADSARAVRSPVSLLVAGPVGAWLEPLTGDPNEALSPYADAGLDEALTALAALEPAPPAGTFVFVLSDLLAPPPQRAWLGLLERRVEPVPVVVQDPVWEQSFPPLGGATLRVLVPGDLRSRHVHLTRRDADDRRRANEHRLVSTLDELRALGLDPVVVGSTDPGEVWAAFSDWAEARRQSRGRLG